MSGIEYWTNNPALRLFPVEEPKGIEWCLASLPLAEWGDNLLAGIARDPQPGKTGFGKWKLLDNFARRYLTAAPEHRVQNGHACLVEALLYVWERLEQAELARAIPELLPPEPAPVIAATVEEEPTEIEVSGIVVGVEEGTDGTTSA